MNDPSSIQNIQNGTFIQEWVNSCSSAGVGSLQSRGWITSPDSWKEYDSDSTEKFVGNYFLISLQTESSADHSLVDSLFLL